MSESRLPTKVGLFVFVGLVTLAVLLVSFSKSSDWFRPTYEIYLKTSNVSGIKKRATVLMAGVPIGYVDTVKLTPDGRFVIMTVRVYKEFIIRRTATFAIEQSGFLGDQYVAINPRDNQGAVLVNGDEVTCAPPFDLQDTARRASDLLDSVGSAVGNLRGAISNVNASLLSPSSITNYASNITVTLNNIRLVSESVRTNVPASLTNIHVLSEKALKAAEEVQTLVHDHTSTVSQAILNLERASSNVEALSSNLRRTGTNISLLIETNGPRVTATLKNIETASVSVTNMLSGLQADLDAGKGLVGGLLKDQEMKTRTDLVLSNLVNLSSNLDLAATHLNQNGIWWMLWKPKYPKTNKTDAVKSGWGYR